MPKQQQQTEPLGPDVIARRRDEAVRRALNTPPKPYKDSKLGKTTKPKSSSSSGKR